MSEYLDWFNTQTTISSETAFYAGMEAGRKLQREKDAVFVVNLYPSYGSMSHLIGIADEIREQEVDGD